VLRIGIDMGGSKIEVIAMDETGPELFRKRVPTRQELGYEHIIGAIHDLYREAVDPFPDQPHTVGVCTPGSISSRSGVLRNSNTQCLNGMPVHIDLEKRVGRAVPVVNDANCFALAEATLGAGRGHKTVFGVIMGTGCGGGIVIDGRVHEGRQGIGGEWGHTVLDPRGAECYCGARGCVETFISGGGLERLWRVTHGVDRSMEDIVSDFRKGHTDALTFMNAFFQRFGRALANLVNVLDPDVIVLGGGLSNIDELYSEGARYVRDSVFSDHFDTPILRNQLGDSAGVIGAALVGRSRKENRPA
jgi:fructokinase